MPRRYLVNNLPDYEVGIPAIPRGVLLSLVQETLRNVVAHTHGRDVTVYTGTAGTAYSLGIVAGKTSRETDTGLPLLRRAIVLADQAAATKSHNSTAASLLAGAAGAHLVACLLHHQASTWHQHGMSPDAQDQELMDASQQERERQCAAYLQISPHATSAAFDMDEFLYGRAGYLFGLLLLRQHLGASSVPETLVQHVVQAILRSGRSLAQRLWHDPPTPLFYTWPNPGGDPYLGAAHGLMGILYVLLHCGELLQQDAAALADIQGSMRFVMSHEQDEAGTRCAGGWWPTMLEVGETGRDAEPLVHWCHGSSGAAFLLCKAYQVLGGQPYLDAAVRAGEVVWQRGLLRKGPGVCHGIGGNAYALLALWRASGDPRWLHRALQFGCFLASDAARSTFNTPDNPLSLWEGRAGALCLLADMLEPETARFPLFELL